MDIGKRIKQAREARGWKTRHLAAAIDGWPSQVARWESGAVVPSDRLLEALASALGVSADELRNGPQTPAQAQQSGDSD